jgi:hypothetical protein
MPPLPQRAPRPAPAPHGTVGNGAVSGPRALLAAAIAAKSAAEGDLNKIIAALDKAEDAKRTADDEVEAAEAALTKARDQAGTALADSFVAGTRSNGHGLLREARLKLDDAVDHAAACDAAVKSLTTAVPERRKAFERASVAVAMAARAVIKAEAPDLAAELKAAVEKVNALRAATYWLFRQSCCADSPERKSWDEAGPLLSDQVEDTGTAKLLRQAQAGHGHDERHESWRQWELAFGALMKDAGAKLPVTGNGRASP